jgi:hypothetical protein
MIVKMVSYTPNRGLSYAYLVRPVDHLPVESTHQLVNRSLSTGNRSPPTGQSASMGFVRACPVHPLHAAHQLASPAHQLVSLPLWALSALLHTSQSSQLASCPSHRIIDMYTLQLYDELTAPNLRILGE